ATSSISQLTKWISKSNGEDVHSLYNSIKFAGAAYRDISADGKLDGEGENGSISQGLVRLTPEIYRHRIATNMLVMANSDRNIAELTPHDILPLAQRFNESDRSIFAGEAVIPVDDSKPVTTNPSLSDAEVVS